MMTKKCPFCAEDIKEAAVLCKHCGMSLSLQPLTHIDQDCTKSVPAWRAAVLGATLLVLFGITLGRSVLSRRRQRPNITAAEHWKPGAGCDEGGVRSTVRACPTKTWPASLAHRASCKAAMNSG